MPKILSGNGKKWGEGRVSSGNLSGEAGKALKWPTEYVFLHYSVSCWKLPFLIKFHLYN